LRSLRAIPVVAAIVAAAVMAGTAAAVSSNAVNISVANGSMHYNQKVFSAKAGPVRINFTNNSTAPHDVALEHNGEFEYGATITITKSTTTTFLNLAKGTYHVYSSVGHDEDKGMSATLIVK